MSQPYRILVTGSRTWDDEDTIRWALGAVISLHGPENVTVVHGACPHGADALADKIARNWGGGLQVERHPADWERHGRRRAGSIRNAAMVAAGANVAFAFINPCDKPRCTRRRKPHGTHGATDCAEQAAKAGIEVRRWTL